MILFYSVFYVTSFCVVLSVILSNCRLICHSVFLICLTFIGILYSFYLSFRSCDSVPHIGLVLFRLICLIRFVLLGFICLISLVILFRLMYRVSLIIVFSLICLIDLVLFRPICLISFVLLGFICLISLVILFRLMYRVSLIILFSLIFLIGLVLFRPFCFVLLNNIYLVLVILFRQLSLTY